MHKSLLFFQCISPHNTDAVPASPPSETGLGCRCLPGSCLKANKGQKLELKDRSSQGMMLKQRLLLLSKTHRLLPLSKLSLFQENENIEQ